MSNLLWTVAAILVLLWVLGFAFHVTLGGFIHVLLVLALITVVVRLVQGRKVV
ncbi:MAG: lmo0937 family membrane protein [Sandaracinaceae bacterium]|nr:lmo0937 family membrane protein [Sandaracinaceae bacterium]